MGTGARDEVGEEAHMKDCFLSGGRGGDCRMKTGEEREDSGEGRVEAVDGEMGEIGSEPEQEEEEPETKTKTNIKKNQQ